MRAKFVAIFVGARKIDLRRITARDVLLRGGMIFFKGSALREGVIRQRAWMIQYILHHSADRKWFISVRCAWSTIDLSPATWVGVDSALFIGGVKIQYWNYWDRVHYCKIYKSNLICFYVNCVWGGGSVAQWREWERCKGLMYAVTICNNPYILPDLSCTL